MTRLFSYSSFFVRWAVALFLVLATYNPSGYSYAHWLLQFTVDLWAFKALAGLLLVVVYLLFGLATLRSLGWPGIAIATALSGALTWAFADLGVLDALGPMTPLMIAMIVFANVLAIGISWSHVRQRLSGQVDSNDVTLR
jgi:hypothetical protein